MPLKSAVFELMGRIYFERPSHRHSVGEHVEMLRRSGEELRSKLRAAEPSDALRHALRHVIGIERWGQRRLRVLLGEDPVMDSHHRYLPPERASWPELLGSFDDTRAETLAIAEALGGEERAVRHDQFGELSARGWLRYLRGHANRELRALR